MDNVLAFQYIVQPAPPPFGGPLSGGFDTYDQTVGGASGSGGGGLASNANEWHLSSDLDYSNTSSLVIPSGGALLRACAETFLIKSIACESTGTTRVTVYGKHPYAVGDTVVMQGFSAVNRDPVGNWLWMNRQQKITELCNGRFGTTDMLDAGSAKCTSGLDGTSRNRSDATCCNAQTGGAIGPLDPWDNRLLNSWDAAAPWGQPGNVSESWFRVALNTQPYCSSIAVAFPFTRVRKKNLQDFNNYFCPAVVADPSLPAPGDKMRGVTGAVQSLSWNKALVVGRPYVTNVTSDNPDGVYGFNRGFGVLAGGTSAASLVPDVIDIKVSFSEAVVASCGQNNDLWGVPEQ